MKVYVINCTSKLTGYKKTFKEGFATSEAAVDFLRHEYGLHGQESFRVLVTKDREYEIVEVNIN